jgi:hypothetical protein
MTAPKTPPAIPQYPADPMRAKAKIERQTIAAQQRLAEDLKKMRGL